MEQDKMNDYELNLEIAGLLIYSKLKFYINENNKIHKKI